jgi:hypothetical protein
MSDKKRQKRQKRCENCLELRMTWSALPTRTS